MRGANRREYHPNGCRMALMRCFARLFSGRPDAGFPHDLLRDNRKRRSPSRPAAPCPTGCRGVQFCARSPMEATVSALHRAAQYRACLGHSLSQCRTDLSERMNPVTGSGMGAHDIQLFHVHAPRLPRVMFDPDCDRKINVGAAHRPIRDGDRDPASKNSCRLRRLLSNVNTGSGTRSACTFMTILHRNNQAAILC